MITDYQIVLDNPIETYDPIQLMQELDLTVDKFAALLGVDRRTVFRWKSGESKPTLQIKQVAALYREKLFALKGMH